MREMDCIEQKVSELASEVNLANHRLDVLEGRQDNLDKLVNTMSVFESEQQHIKGDVAEIKQDVKSMKEKPGKLLDGLVEKIIWAVIGGLLAYALASVGIQG